jgi:hypothetical protein
MHTKTKNPNIVADQGPFFEKKLKKGKLDKLFLKKRELRKL